MAWNTIDNSPTFEDDSTSYTAELKEGQFLGESRNYRLEKNLGAGGMGEVWLASEIRGGVEIRKVVVKTLRPDRRGNEGAQEKALKQFQLIQSLNHTNICPIYVIEKDPACGFLIVMGYANGGSYADWFSRQPKQDGGLPLKTVCDVLRPIADALDFAHSKNVIHRDVKPENMMFTADGTSWLIDFGIAARLRSESMATMGQFSSSGTERYMAPEQKKGEFQAAQTDEYSLAMVALEFLAGSLSPLAFSLLSPEIQTVLGKALSETPGDRFSTCREFIDALDSTGSTLPASSKPNVLKAPHPPIQPKPVTTGTSLPASSRKAGDRKILTADGIDYAFRWCPPGEFMMGGKDNNEKPIHKVKLTKGFWMLETVVTQAMWQSVMGTNPSRIRGDLKPVVNVSWIDCMDFCKQLSCKLGQIVKLPTEAQWEYACRAGRTGNSGKGLDSMAWNMENSVLTIHEVGRKKPNAWGLYDMQGNVDEWCSDYYSDKYYEISPKNDPENTTVSMWRVRRGGCWARGTELCGLAHRGCSMPDKKGSSLGLRVLLVPDPEE